MRRRVATWIAGGWGEELSALARPRAHADIDLLLPRAGFDELDALELDWIAAKRFPWKRAFVVDAVMVEVLLVERDTAGWFTALHGRRHEWPANVFARRRPLPIASAAALVGYRNAYGTREA